MILVITMNPAIDKTYQIDDFNKGNVHRVVKTNLQPGGKGINVARVAKQLGGLVLVTGFVGGNAGRDIRQGLHELGIEHDFVEVEEETRTCLNVLDTRDRSSTEILEGGPTITRTNLDELQLKMMKHSHQVKAVVMTGSLPKGVPSHVYADLIAMLKPLHVPVFLDTSGDALIHGTGAVPFFIKPNEEEAEVLTDFQIQGESEYIRCIRKLLLLGISCVVISLSKDGSYVGYQNRVYRCKAPEIRAVNSVGSGDAYVAGMAVGVSKGLQLESCIRLATASGAANALDFRTGHVDLSTVEDLMGLVSISQVDS